MPIFQQQGLQYGTYYSNSAKKPGPSMQKYIIIGLILAVLLGGAMLLLSLSSNSAKSDINLLAARENSLMTLTTGSQSKIRSADLATANSNASILLASDVNTLLGASGTDKLDSDLIKQEADTNSDKLEQSSLLNKFDETYRQIVIDKTATMITQATKLRDQSSGSSKTALDQVLTNIQSINKQFTQASQ